MNEEQYEKGHEFLVEFKALVRKYVPEYPKTDEELMFLYYIQDMTSCFQPYIWNGERNG